MTSRDFCYWLQGFFELSGPDTALTKEQTWVVQKHLAMVFKHEIDPSFGGPTEQGVLNEVHESKNKKTEIKKDESGEFVYPPGFPEHMKKKKGPIDPNEPIPRC